MHAHACDAGKTAVPETSNVTHIECKHIGGVSRGESLRPTRGGKQVRRGEQQMDQGSGSKDAEALAGQVQQVAGSMWRTRWQGPYPTQLTGRLKGSRDSPHVPIKVARQQIETLIGVCMPRRRSWTCPRGPCAHCQAVRVDNLLPLDALLVSRKRLVRIYHGSRRGHFCNL